MAVTKTHPIKSTLKAAIDYILNPEKTDGKLLASSFGCGLETADIEFAWTREAAGDRGTHLGRHLIQSFAVGETTPEEAHKIGMELAGAVLGGKYEFVLTTHVDKDHLHNHLIFNSVSFVDKVYSNPQKRLSNCPRKDKKRTGARCRKSATAPLFSMGYSSSVKINSLSENSLSVMACSLFTAAAASWRISSSM